MSSAFQLSLDKQGIAWLEFDLPGEEVNKLSTEVMEELDKRLDELWKWKDVKAVVITSKKSGIFVAGADIEEIRRISDPEAGETKARRGQLILEKINRLEIPVIAAINGTCLGGGLELALACHYRIAKDDPQTRIGFPEIKLGILPGFGGTQRLPRLVGLRKALDLILTGRNLDVQKAYQMGIIDKFVPREYPDSYFSTAVNEFVAEILQTGGKKYIRRRKKSGLLNFLFEGNTLGRCLIFSQARKKVLKRTGGHYPAPLKAIIAMKQGLRTSLQKGLMIEAKLLGELVVTEICKNLISVFYLTEEIRKDPGVDVSTVKPRQLERLGVLGAGVMGGGIAQLLAQNDILVRLKDVDHQAIGKGLAAAAKVFQTQVKQRRIRPLEMQIKMGLISPTLDYSGFGQVDGVIEAVVEDMDVKKKVLVEVEEKLPSRAIFASNTSALSITELAKVSKRPERVIGMHFFNPPHRMSLVEVIRGEKTSDETVATIVALAKKLGKSPIVVKDSPGFVVNRLLLPYLNEAAFLLEEGVRIEAIDKAMLNFGMPMGPIYLLDEIGIDVAAKVAHIMEDAFGERMQASKILEKVVDAGRVGKKGNKGFYKFNGKKKRVDRSVYADFKELINKGDKLNRQQMQERMVFAMINEAARCIEEGITRRPTDIDVGVILGMGFPPFRGGLLKYADTIGLATVAERLQTFYQDYGKRYEPASLLLEMAERGRSFYEEPDFL